jgi:hydrogenase maturation protein HypF
MQQPLPAVLACGAWLKNTACLLGHRQARWSALHGDLQDPTACRRLEASLRSLARDARDAQAPVAALAHDLHPDFFSTRIAIALAHEWGVPAIAVQHHHAHIAAVIAEHDLDEPVIGLALDGVGLGSDGTAWGGELLRVDGNGWDRLGSLWPLALPGGDVAAREPWRMAASALHALGAGDGIADRFSPSVGPALAGGVQRMLAAGLNCPPTSSTGRWFDAAAGALGLSVRQAHEAEAAMALEAAAARWLAGHTVTATAAWPDAGNLRLLDPRPLLERLFAWPMPQRNADEAAAWFHLSLAQGLAGWAAAAARQAGCGTVCLGGGCFFNAILRIEVTQGLQARGLRVLSAGRSGCGDAALALGQAWVAAHSLRARTFLTPRKAMPCA